jgi:CcmD family protein
MDNLTYLFWGYTIFWVAIFIYAWSLLKKSRELRRDIESFRDSIFMGTKRSDE